MPTLFALTTTSINLVLDCDALIEKIHHRLITAFEPEKDQVKAGITKIAQLFTAFSENITATGIIGNLSQHGKAIVAFFYDLQQIFRLHDHSVRIQEKDFLNPFAVLLLRNIDIGESIYKPEMENKFIEILNKNYQETVMHKICCLHEPQIEKGSLIINVCAGCDKRFGTLYEGISTISLWEILDELDSFPYPDCQGFKMSVHDACSLRENHKFIRLFAICPEI